MKSHASLLHENLAFDAEQVGEGLSAAEVILRSDCVIGQWVMELMRCVQFGMSCIHLLWVNISWNFAMGTAWPIFWLLSAAQIAKDESYSEKSAAGYLAEQASLQSKELQVLYSRDDVRARDYFKHVRRAERIVRRAEVSWQSGGYSNGFSNGDLLYELSMLHWNLRHGFCPGSPEQRLSITTRHTLGLQYKMCVPSSSEFHFLPTINAFGYWPDADILAHLLLILLPADCAVVDVGANVGAVTFLLAKLGYPVLAIEADRGNFEHLVAGARQMAREGAGWIDSHHIAVGNESDGLVNVNLMNGLPSMETQVAWNSHLEASEAMGGMAVKARRLDDVALAWQADLLRPNSKSHEEQPTLRRGQAGRASRICALKLDIEGSEYLALLGAPVLVSQVGIVFLELNRAAAEVSPSPEAVLALLPRFHFYKVSMEYYHNGLPEFVVYPVLRSHPCMSSGSWKLWNELADTWAEHRCGPVWNVLAVRQPLRHQDFKERLGLPWVLLHAFTHMP